jgi:hypothetical protein
MWIKIALYSLATIYFALTGLGARGNAHPPHPQGPSLRHGDK